MTEPNTESRMRPNAAPFFPSQPFPATLHHFPHPAQVSLPLQSPMQFASGGTTGSGSTGGLNPNAPEFIPGVSRPRSANMQPLVEAPWTVPAVRPAPIAPTSAMAFASQQQMNESRRYIEYSRMAATPTQPPYPEVDPWGAGRSAPSMSTSAHFAQATSASSTSRHLTHSPPSVPQEVVSFTHFATMPVPRQSRPVSAARVEHPLPSQPKEILPSSLPNPTIQHPPTRPGASRNADWETHSNWRSPNETSHSHREEPEAELEDVFGPPASGGGVSAVSSRTRASPPVAPSPSQPDQANEYYLEDDIDREGVKIISLNSDDDERVPHHSRGTGHRGSGRRGTGRGGTRVQTNNRHGGRSGTDYHHVTRGSSGRGRGGRGGYERSSRRGGGTTCSPAIVNAENAQPQQVKDKQRIVAPAPEQVPAPEEEPILAPKQEAVLLPGAHPGDQVWKQFRRTAGWLQPGEEPQTRSEAPSETGQSTESPAARKVVANPMSSIHRDSSDMPTEPQGSSSSNAVPPRRGPSSAVSNASRNWGGSGSKSKNSLGSSDRKGAADARSHDAPNVSKSAARTLGEDSTEGRQRTTHHESDWTQVVNNRRQHHGALSAPADHLPVETRKAEARKAEPKLVASPGPSPQAKPRPLPDVPVPPSPLTVWQQGRRLRKASLPNEKGENNTDARETRNFSQEAPSTGADFKDNEASAPVASSVDATQPSVSPAGAEEKPLPSPESVASKQTQKRSLLRLTEKPRVGPNALPDKGVYVPPSKRTKMREEAERAAAEEARLEAEAAEKARLDRIAAEKAEQEEQEKAEAARLLAEEEEARRIQEEKKRAEAEAEAEKKRLEIEAAEAAAAAAAAIKEAEERAAKEEEERKKKEQEEAVKKAEEAEKKAQADVKLERTTKAVGFPKITAKFGRSSMSLEKADALAKLDAETISPPKASSNISPVSSSLVKNFTSLLTPSMVAPTTLDAPSASSGIASSSQTQEAGDAVVSPTNLAPETAVPAAAANHAVAADPAWPEPEINAAGRRVWSVASLMMVRGYPSCNVKNKAMSGRFVVNFLESQRMRQTRSTAGHEYAMWEPSRAAEILPIKSQVLTEKFARDGFKMFTRSADIVARTDSWRTEVKPATPLPVLPETAWSIAQKKEKETGDELKIITRRLRGMLNKLTLEKFEKLYPQFLALVTKPEEVAITIQLIFEKATMQHSYVEMYADLTCRLDTDLQANGVLKALTAEEKKAKKSPAEDTLRTMILKACQDSFQDNLLGEFSPPDDVDEEEKFELLLKYKTRMKGNLKFAGELLKRGMMHHRVAGVIIDKLMDHKGEHQLEALATFMITVGPFLEHHSSFVYSQGYHGRLEKIRELTTDPEVPHRVQCLLKDVCEQRVPASNPRSMAGT